MGFKFKTEEPKCGALGTDTQLTTPAVLLPISSCILKGTGASVASLPVRDSPPASFPYRCFASLTQDKTL